jgi:signal transduction histidine kinase
MKERVQMVNGELNIKSQPGSGTTVQLIVVEKEQ